MVKQRISTNIKLLAVEYYKNNNLSFDKVAEIFKINEKTLRRWLNRYESNNLETQKQEKESYKIKEKHVKYALDVLKKQPTLSISMLRAKFSDFVISQGHLAKVIRDNNLTRKRTKIRHYPETRYRKQCHGNKKTSSQTQTIIYESVCV